MGKSDSSKKGMKPPDDEDDCKICNKKCKSEDQAIECDRCQKWIHLDCTDISPKAYKVYSEHKMAKMGYFWFCNDCRDNITASKDTNNNQIENLSKQIAEINAQLKNIQETQSKMEKSNASINEIADTISKPSVSKSWAEVASDSSSENSGIRLITSLTKEVLNGQKKLSEERKDREQNAIMFNIEENTKKDHDQEFFKRFCQKTLSLKDIPEVKISRLGQKYPDSKNNRPLKVSFTNMWEKRKFFSNLYKMKQDDQLDKKIRIAHDMSQEDRLENKRLLKFAYEKNITENPDTFRYKVRGPPWNTKIVKVYQKN